MPTYDYQCSDCGHTFDEFQSYSEPHLKKCPKCKKNKLVRLIGTGTAVLFKGSGFYETDYRSDSYKSAAKADSSSPTSTPKDSSASPAKDSSSSSPSDSSSKGSSAKGGSSSKKSKD